MRIPTSIAARIVECTIVEGQEPQRVRSDTDFSLWPRHQPAHKAVGVLHHRRLVRAALAGSQGRATEPPHGVGRELRRCVCRRAAVGLAHRGGQRDRLRQDVFLEVHLRELPRQRLPAPPRVVDAWVQPPELLPTELVSEKRNSAIDGSFEHRQARLDRPAHGARHQQLRRARRRGQDLGRRRLLQASVGQVRVVQTSGHLAEVAALRVRRPAGGALLGAPDVVRALAVAHEVDALGVLRQWRALGMGKKQGEAARAPAEVLSSLLGSGEVQGPSPDTLLVLRR
mmetsp:Transcript_143824/g.460414  ORF Transcript_143824/g.460414 Transcript_143824/m.460414 type:complete len:284 (+) Transcript_143824:554-1405(+)